MRVIGFVTSTLLYLLLLPLVLYAAGAIFYCAPLSAPWPMGLVLAFLLLVLGSVFVTKTHKHRLLGIGLVLLPVYAWYVSIQPQMQANWAKDVAVLPEFEVNGDTLTVKNIRNFQYRSDTDFDVQYYDKAFDLNQVQSVDLFLSYWGTTSIAHTIMSFGFSNGDYLPISIETRKEVGEEYSAVKGFFKKFELIYVLADERDVIGVRVNHRNEDIYLYRLRPTPEQSRKLLLDYLKSVKSLETRPAFYNALTHNCTTSILPHLRALGPLQFDWSLIANGNLDRWRYEAGVWGKEIPFEEFRRLSHINTKVKSVLPEDDFSAKIREGSPSIKYLKENPAEGRRSWGS